MRFRHEGIFIIVAQFCKELVSKQSLQCDFNFSLADIWLGWKTGSAKRFIGEAPP